MTFHFGTVSEERLATCHPKIQLVVRLALKKTKEDFSVLEGWRPKARQNELFAENKSQLQFPDSWHNKSPSRAIDIVPYPVDWNDSGRFYMLATYMFAAAAELEIKINWGGHWTSFQDFPHWELDKSEV